MDFVRSLLIIQFLTIGVILGAAWLTIYALKPRPKIKRSFEKPKKKQIINTPSGSFVINEKREPVVNDDQALWEREN